MSFQRLRPVCLSLATLLALGASSTVQAQEPTEPASKTPTPEQAADPSAPEAGVPQVKLNVLSRLGSEYAVVRDEIMATATAALEAEGFEVVEEAQMLVHVVIVRPNPESEDYAFQFGYSRSADDTVHRQGFVECPRCSAEQMLAGVDEATRAVARQLLDDDGSEEPSVADEPEAVAEPPPDEPTTATTDVDRPERDGVWMWATGVGVTSIGGAVTVGAIVATAMGYAERDRVSPIGWAMLGSGVAATAIGGVLVGVGAKRRRAHRARVGLAPTFRGGLVTLSGRF